MIALALVMALGGVLDDSLAARMREEDFLRASSDLGLATVLDELERLEPAATAEDPACGILRRIALMRLAVRAPLRTTDERARSLSELRELRTALVTSPTKDARLPLWLADAAEDELLLGFLGTEFGPQAIAGSAAAEVASRSHASLDRVLSSLDEAAASDPLGAPAVDGELEQRLEADRAVRRPLLRAVALALQAAIDRATTARAEREERSAMIKPVLLEIQRLRPHAPSRLRVEADLGEAAAAAVVPDSESARFAAARLALAGDAVAFALSRILSVDALVGERRVEEALAQLQPLVSAQGMPPSLALLCADASVRTRVALGKSVASASTLSPWIGVLRQADPAQRGWIRDAVMDRMASALGTAHIDAALPTIAEVAHARELASKGRSESQAWNFLEATASDARDSEAQACALSALAWASARIADAGATATALARLARHLESEPAGAIAMSRAVTLELALDDDAPDLRLNERTATLDLARTRYPDLPERSLVSIAQDAALARDSLDRLLTQDFSTPSAAQAAAFKAIASRLRESLARCDQTVAGVARAKAAMASCDVAADLLTPEPIELAAADARATPWAEFNETDARRLARLRLELAARRAHDDGTRAAECAAIPALTSAALTEFMEASITAPTRERLLSAIAVSHAWESAHGTSPSRDLRRLRCKAALLAPSWEEALEESRLLAQRTGAGTEDLALRCAALRGAIKAQSRGIEPSLAVQELMDVGKRLSDASAKQTPDWWLAQTAQLEAATLAGRGGEPVRARIARLRALDASLGGASFESAISALDRAIP